MHTRAVVLAFLAFALPANAQIGTPQSRLEHLVVSDAGARDVARRLLRRNTPRVRFCYERELLNTAGIAGRVRLRIEVATDGTVPSTAVLHASPAMTNVASCLAHASQSMMFPSRAAPWRIDVEWVFSLPSAPVHHAGLMGR